MELQERLGTLEEELNLLKVEIKTVLVDLREELLKREGPMGPAESPPVIDFVSASQGPRHNRPAAPEPAAHAAPTAPPHAHTPAEGHPARPEWPGAQRVQLPAADYQTEPDWPEEPAHRAGPPNYPHEDGRAMIDFTQPGHTPAAPAPAPAMPPPPSGELTWGVVQIASLGKWAEMAARRIGRSRLEEVLSVHELLTGRHDAAVREALLRMVDLCGAGPGPQDVSMNDVLAVLAQLDALFRSHSLSEVTVLSMLSEVA